VNERTAPSRAVERLPRSFELDARGQAIRRLAAIWPRISVCFIPRRLALSFSADGLESFYDPDDPILNRKAYFNLLQVA
jgi:hypothetical protein